MRPLLRPPVIPPRPTDHRACAMGPRRCGIRGRGPHRGAGGWGRSGGGGGQGGPASLPSPRTPRRRWAMNRRQFTESGHRQPQAVLSVRPNSGHGLKGSPEREEGVVHGSTFGTFVRYDSADPR